METKTYRPNEIDHLFLTQKDLKGAIAQIETELSAEGKVLCEIRINGMNLTAEDEIKFETCPRDEVKDLEIKAQTVAQLLDESKKSLVNYLLQMREVTFRASEILRTGVLRDANDMISSIINGTGWVVEMLNQVRSLDPGYTDIETTWIATEAEFLRVSRELLTAFQQDDLVLVADNLEYEWTTAIDQWLKVLSLLDQVKSQADNTHE